MARPKVTFEESSHPDPKDVDGIKRIRYYYVVRAVNTNEFPIHEILTEQEINDLITGAHYDITIVPKKV